MSKLPQKNQISETNVFERIWIEVSTLMVTSMIMDGSCWRQYNLAQMEDGNQFSKSKVLLDVVVMKRSILCVLDFIVELIDYLV